MRGKVATIKFVNYLALIGIFGLATIAGYSITKIARASIVKSHSNMRFGTLIDMVKDDIHDGTTFRAPTSHFHSNLFEIADNNTRAAALSSGLQSNTSSSPAPIIPDVTTSVVSNGMVPVFYKLNTEKPVVFLTVDDGVVKDPAAIAFMNRHHMVATLFLNDSKISDNYNYFKILQTAGSVVENHTVNHIELTKLNYAQQKKEICDNADKFATVFGKRPTLFRPPYGAFNDITRKAAADCGMTALIHWHAKANGGSMQYQRDDKLQPGDIVLMHFRKEVIADLTAFYEAAKKANLTPVLLEDWIR